MRPSPVKEALIISLLYLIFSGLYISLSDLIVKSLSSDPNLITQFQTFKGWGFVTLTSIMLFTVLLNRIKKLQHEFEIKRSLEKSLGEVENRFSLMFENSGEAILLTSPDGSIHGANPEACKIFGRTESEIRNIGRNGLIDINDRRLELALKTREKTGTFKGELNFLRKDGSVFPGELTSTIYKDTLGNLRTSMIIKDITERNRLQSEILSAKNELTSILERITDAFVALNVNWQYTYVNKKAAQIFNRKPEELLGKHIWTEFPEGIGQPFHLAYEKAMREQVFVQIEEYYTPYDKWFENRIYPSKNGISIFFHDITERKQAEESLKAQELLLRNVLKTLPVGVWITDANGIIQQGNEAAQRIWAGARYVGIEQYGEYKGWWADTGKLIESEEWALARAIRKGETSIGEEIIIECFDKSKKTILNSALPVRDSEGRITGAVVVNQDITERKQAESILRERENVMKLFIKYSPASIAMFNDKMEYLVVSDRWKQDYNLGEQDILGMSHYKVFPDLPERWKQFHKRCLSGEIMKCDEDIFPRADSTTDWIKWEMHPWYSSDNVVGGAIIFSELITNRILAEQEIITTRDRLTRVLNGITDAFITLDKDFRITYINPQAARINKKSPEEFLGKTHWEEWPASLGTAVERNYRKAISENIPVHFEHRYYVEGEYDVWLDIHAYPNQDGLALFYRDITERKLVEKAVIESEERYRQLLDLAPVGIAVHQEGKIVFTNPAGLRLLGAVTYDQIIGKSITEIISPEGHEAALKRIQKMLAGETGLYPSEDVYLKLDGTPLQVEVIAVPITFKGKPAVQVIVSDITDRKKAEEAIKTERDFSNALLDGLPGIFYFYDSNFNFLKWNRNFEIVSGYSGEEIKTMKPLEFFAEGEKKLLTERIQEVFTKGYSEVEANFLAKNGKLIPYFFNGLKIKYDGKDCLIGVGINIESKRKAEANVRYLMNRLIESEEEMRKNASQKLHDQVGQNLTALSINFNYIQTQISPGSKKKIGSRLNDSLSILDNTIEEIRNIMVELRPAILDDYGLSAALIWSLDKFGERTNINVHYKGTDLTERLPINVEYTIFRIAQEALHNISKHAKAKNIHVDLEEMKDIVRLSIKDDGIGFDSQSIKQRKIDGGWGLAGMVERMKLIGGDLSIVSAAGRGTIISIEINR